MTSHRPQNISGNRTAAIAVIISSILIVFAFWVLFQTQSRLYEERLLTDAKENVQKASSYILGYFYAQNNWVHLEQTQTQLNEAPNVIYSYIVGETGKIDLGPTGLGSKEIGMHGLPWEPDLKIDLRGSRIIRLTATVEISARYSKRIRSGEQLGLITSPIYCESKGTNCGELRVLISFESIREMIHRLGLILMMTCALLVSAVAAAIFSNIRFHSAQVDQELRTAQSLADLSARVAHDIRSPLATLKMLDHEVSWLPSNEREILRSVIDRIHRIAEDLLEKHRSSMTGPDKVEKESLATLLRKIVEEKKAEFRNITDIQISSVLPPSAHLLHCTVPGTELLRTMSNLINNSREAMRGPGTIVVALKAMGTNAEIAVLDDGPGIPAEILHHLGSKRGLTHGKLTGTGLGLYHARELCSKWKGVFSIESTEGIGTKVTMRLPLVSTSLTTLAMTGNFGSEGI